MANFISAIISLTLGIVIFANLFMTSVKNTSTTALPAGCTVGVNCTSSAWSTSEIALWGVVGLAGVIGIVYGVLGVFGLI